MEPAEAIRVLREAGIAVPKTEASSAASFAANSSHREMDASKVSTEDPDLAADLHTSAPTVPRSLPGREQQQPGSGEQYWRYRCADLQTELDALRERHERYRQEMTEALALEMQRREYAESKLRNLSARFESIDSSEPLQENRLNVSAPPPSQASPARLSRNDPLASPEFVSKLSVRERQRLFMERVASMEPRRP
jgi:acyl transferase domain-containing protein